MVPAGTARERSSTAVWPEKRLATPSSVSAWLIRFERVDGISRRGPSTPRARIRRAGGDRFRRRRDRRLPKRERRGSAGERNRRLHGGTASRSVAVRGEDILD